VIPSQVFVFSVFVLFSFDTSVYDYISTAGAFHLLNTNKDYSQDTYDRCTSYSSITFEIS
jgi:hypothetical protein